MASLLPNPNTTPHDSISTRLHTRLFQTTPYPDSQPSFPLPPNELHIFTDGSKTNDGVGAGGVLYCRNKESATFHFKLNDQNSVFQAETVAIMETGKALLRQRLRNKVINIFSDSRSTIQSLSSYKISSRTTLKTIYILNNVARFNTLHISWVRAHAGMLVTKELTPWLNWELPSHPPHSQPPSPSPPSKVTSNLSSNRDGKQNG